MTIGFRDIIGFRGEKIVELTLTNDTTAGTLFRPGFLGDKWPAVDFYVELNHVAGSRPYFFAQAKTTTADLGPRADNLAIRTKAEDIGRLLELPGPTYILGVHEPTHRVFIRAVHSGVPRTAITKIPLAYELHHDNLQKLHAEVSDFWRSTRHKPSTSEFS